MLESHKERFLESSIGNYEQAVRLAGDASSRVYDRIFSGDTSYILCEDVQFKNVPIESYPYLIVYNIFCEESISVPSVLAHDSRNGLLLIQDVGDNLLEIIYDDLSSNDRRSIYKELIDVLIKIQEIRRGKDIPPFSLSFDVDKLMFEFDFFTEHALKGYFKSRITKNLKDELKGEFLKISKNLYKPEFFVFTHRDFHSRNIILLKNKPYLIDFQDARQGLPQYDLVSILRDSYVRLNENEFTILKEYYYRLSIKHGIHEMSVDEFDYYFDLMAFQRNIKAIGTFTYQVTSLGVDRYEKYISPTLSYLSDYIQRRKELKRAGEMLQSYIGVDW